MCDLWEIHAWLQRGAESVRRGATHDQERIWGLPWNFQIYSNSRFIQILLWGGRIRVGTGGRNKGQNALIYLGSISPSAIL